MSEDKQDIQAQNGKLRAENLGPKRGKRLRSKIQKGLGVAALAACIGYGYCMYRSAQFANGIAAFGRALNAETLRQADEWQGIPHSNGPPSIKIK